MKRFVKRNMNSKDIRSFNKMKWNNIKGKKLAIAVCMMLVIFSVTGCGVTLTEEQNRLIAQYAADLLLKYDADYQSHYENTESSDNSSADASSEVISTEATENVTEATTNASTEATTEATTESSSTTSTATDSTSNGDDSSGSATTEGTSGSGEQNPPSSSDNVTDIAEIVGINGVSITYNKCLFLDRYPSIDQDGAFIYLEADPGYKLAVVKFDIRNKNSTDTEIDLLDTDIDYKLVLDGSKAAKPMLTILMDDLGTFSSTVPAKSEQSAVLVFQIADSLATSDHTMFIRVNYNGSESIINIQ